MKVGWLADNPNYIGGAELTQAEFGAAAPEGVEIIDCPPGGVETGLDHYCVFNSVSYEFMEVARAVTGAGMTRYWNDLAPHGDPALRLWQLGYGTNVFTSPLHRDRFPYELTRENFLIPPPLDLGRFRASQNGHKRSGAVSVAAWMNHGKAPHLVAEWAQENGGVDFYGGGALAPPGSTYVDYEDMPKLLRQYETFVFLPTAVEPFGRTVVEAWAAGCKIVTNELVGARYWIENDPDALETAATDFWDLVLA